MGIWLLPKRRNWSTSWGTSLDCLQCGVNIIIAPSLLCTKNSWAPYFCIVQHLICTINYYRYIVFLLTTRLGGRVATGLVFNLVIGDSLIHITVEYMSAWWVFTVANVNFLHLWNMDYLCLSNPVFVIWL